MQLYLPSLHSKLNSCQTKPLYEEELKSFLFWLA
jgi:hypothetical protein